MDKLHLLAVALGLASLAGVNLYLTVFVTGLAINQHWITLSSTYQSLDILSHPAVITIAGILYVLEFFADKIPWVDSAWDAVHTIIRPIGGALLAIQTLGDQSPTLTVIAALLGGGTSLVTHTAKSATRLTANTSPEPFSNIALSFAEDVAVVGGLALIYSHPFIALGVFAVAIAALVYFAPRIFRAMKAKVYLALQKLNFPADLSIPATLPHSLPSRLIGIFSDQNARGETIAWAVPCISGGGKRIPPNLFGALVATNESSGSLVFVARKNRQGFSRTIDISQLRAAREPKFLSENLVIVPAEGKGPKYVFMFPRWRGALVEKIVEYLSDRATAPVPEESEEPAEVLERV